MTVGKPLIMQSLGTRYLIIQIVYCVRKKITQDWRLRKFMLLNANKFLGHLT